MSVTTRHGRRSWRFLSALVATVVAAGGCLFSTSSAFAASSGPVSDDFSAGSLNSSLWSVVDHVGDGSGVGDGHGDVGTPGCRWRCRRGWRMTRGWLTVRWT